MSWALLRLLAETASGVGVGSVLNGWSLRPDACTFNGEKVLVIATGNVEAGVDLGDIHKDDVSVKGGTVTIDLPKPEILSPPASTRRRPAFTTTTSAP